MLVYSDERKEEYFEKCRAILKVLDSLRVEEPEKATLIWAARDYLEMLGYATGIVSRQ